MNVIYTSYKQCLLTVGNTEQTDVITRKVMKWTYLGGLGIECTVVCLEIRTLKPT